jgi:hypothetical protein
MVVVMPAAVRHDDTTRCGRTDQNDGGKARQALDELHVASPVRMNVALQRVVQHRVDALPRTRARYFVKFYRGLLLHMKRSRKASKQGIKASATRREASPANGAAA